MRRFAECRRRPPIQRHFHLAAWTAALLLLVAASGCQSSAAAPTGLLAQYPRSEALDAIAATHAAGAAEDRGQYILLTTWFVAGNPNDAMMCRVDPSGRVSVYEYLTPAAIKSDHKQTLRPDQMAALAQWIDRLPPDSSPRPSLANLLIASFNGPDGWTTRIYDRANPPAPLVDAFRLAGARLDTP